MWERYQRELYKEENHRQASVFQRYVCRPINLVHRFLTATLDLNPANHAQTRWPFSANHKEKAD